MGQTGSTQTGKHGKELSKSASTLEFDPGLKSKLDVEPSPTKEISVKLDKPFLHEKHHVPDAIPHSADDLKTNKSTVPTVFRWEYGGKDVYLSGSFNDWKAKIPLAYSGGEFSTIIELKEGEHQFKYHVDGHWIHDPNQATVNDTFGGRNNVIAIARTDFDVCQALEHDECATTDKDSFTSTRQSPPGSYAQLVPNLNEPFGTALDGHLSAPPALPPHLLNVILNKEAVDQEDPTLLPVPDHVGLNHLYALSIKDAVMTLSATHRYKRKYITTVLYKPVRQ